MNLFHKKLQCEQCNKKFASYEDLVDHVRHQHHHAIVKCNNCGKEFIHEKDRLHHSREEHQEKVKGRVHKNEHKHENKAPSPQDEVDAHMRNFSDNF